MARCVATGGPSCADGDPCTEDFCAPDSGRVAGPVPLGTACDDAVGCTASSCQTTVPSPGDCGQKFWWPAEDYGLPDVCNRGTDDNLECSGSLSHSGAEAFCASFGGRLCTAAELSQTPCGVNRLWTAAGASNQLGAVPVECTGKGSSTSARASCCADTDISEPAPTCVTDQYACTGCDYETACE